MIACSVCNTIFLCCSPADSISVIDTGNGIKIQLLFGFLRLSESYLPPNYMNTSVQLLGIPLTILDILLEYLPKLLICVQFQKIFRKLKITSTPFFPEIIFYINRIAYSMLFLGIFSQFLFTDDCISNRVSNILFQQSITIFMDSCRMYRTDSCKHFQTRLYASERIR